ncbi:hypothetical protein IJZ97_01695, partial [bacterium]|nr:hypothetical protein [bacterium]
GEALKVMNVNSNLAGFDSTQAFFDELCKHIKITRTCDIEHLTDCFAETITTDADPIDTSKLKQSKNLNSANDYGTETIGVQFADGVNALIAYNKSIVNDPYSSEVVKVTGTDQKSVGLSTQALSILYDVSGNKTPNSYGTGKDIRGLNINIKTGASVQVVGTSYSAINCADSTSEGYEYCNANDISISGDYPNNNWAGAKKACADLGMSLPDHGGTPYETCPTDAAEDTLCGIYNNRDEYGISSGWFWSSSENDAVNAYDVDFDYGYVDDRSKYGQNSVVCIGN